MIDTSKQQKYIMQHLLPKQQTYNSITYKESQDEGSKYRRRKYEVGIVINWGSANKTLSEEPDSSSHNRSMR
jgi:hypothetical protein